MAVTRRDCWQQQSGWIGACVVLALVQELPWMPAIKGVVGALIVGTCFEVICYVRRHARWRS